MFSAKEYSKIVVMKYNILPTEKNPPVHASESFSSVAETRNKHTTNS